MPLLPAKVWPSRVHGLDVFALAPVCEGALVWQLDPGIDHFHPVAWLDSQPEYVRHFVATHCVLSLNKQHFLVLSDRSMFVNHSLRPKLAPDDDHPANVEWLLVAARDIAAGAELTINYWEIDGADRDRLSHGEGFFEQLTA